MTADNEKARARMGNSAENKRVCREEGGMGRSPEFRKEPETTPGRRSRPSENGRSAKTLDRGTGLGLCSSIFFCAGT